MAELVADRLLGGAAEFPGADTATKLKLLGVDVASFGDAHAATEGALEVVFHDAVAGSYRKLVVSDDGRTLLGGVLVGDASSYGTLRPLLGRALPAEPAALLAPSGPVTLGIDALPQDAQVCSCNAVTRRGIEYAIREQGADTVAAVKSCTKAGTTCGSCVPTLARLLSACGIERSTLCASTSRRAAPNCSRSSVPRAPARSAS